MTRTITRSYDTYDIAAAVVEELQRAGFNSDDISIIGTDANQVRDAADEGSHAGEGAGIGGALGGAAGLLAGLGLIAIPGIGPVVAAGWLATAAAGAAVGAAAGGLVGALTSAGISREDADYYAETVRRGGSIVSVRASEADVPLVESIMDRASPHDMVERRAEYEREGWKQFDPNAGVYRTPPI